MNDVVQRLRDELDGRTRMQLRAVRLGVERRGHKWDTVQRKLRGRRGLALDELVMLADLLGLNAEWLLRGAGERRSPMAALYHAAKNSDVLEPQTTKSVPLRRKRARSTESAYGVLVTDVPPAGPTVPPTKCRLCGQAFEQVTGIVVRRGDALQVMRDALPWPPYCEDCRSSDGEGRPVPNFSEIRKQGLARVVRCACVPERFRDARRRPVRFYVETRATRASPWPNCCPGCGKAWRGARRFNPPKR